MREGYRGHALRRKRLLHVAPLTRSQSLGSKSISPVTRGPRSVTGSGGIRTEKHEVINDLPAGSFKFVIA